MQHDWMGALHHYIPQRDKTALKATTKLPLYINIRTLQMHGTLVSNRGIKNPVGRERFLVEYTRFYCHDGLLKSRGDIHYSTYKTHTKRSQRFTKNIQTCACDLIKNFLEVPCHLPAYSTTLYIIFALLHVHEWENEGLVRQSCTAVQVIHT